MSQLCIKYVSISMIKPYKNNPRKNERAVSKVAESIKAFGFNVPILIDENNEIIAGHTRLLAAEKLEMNEVPCIVVKGLTQEQRARYRLIDNKTNELASWDYELLMEELEDLEGIEEIDMSVFEFFTKKDNEHVKTAEKLDSNLDDGVEIDLSDFEDEAFENECPYCGFRW